MTLNSQVGEFKKLRKNKLKEEEEKKAKANSSGKTDDKKEYVSTTDYRKQRYEQAPKWMKTEPKDGKTTKKDKEVEYHWCTYHKLWQKHKAADCRMNPANISDGKKAEDKKDYRAEGNNESGNNN
jgi:hypothetical protein